MAWNPSTLPRLEPSLNTFLNLNSSSIIRLLRSVVRFGPVRKLSLLTVALAPSGMGGINGISSSSGSSSVGNALFLVHGRDDADAFLTRSSGIDLGILEFVSCVLGPVESENAQVPSDQAVADMSASAYNCSDVHVRRRPHCFRRPCPWW